MYLNPSVPHFQFLGLTVPGTVGQKGLFVPGRTQWRCIKEVTDGGVGQTMG